MGMTKMFSNAAEFDNMLEQPEPLKVSKVLHKAFIEVNEEGTEAAAATGTFFYAFLFAFNFNLHLGLVVRVTLRVGTLFFVYI